MMFRNKIVTSTLASLYPLHVLCLLTRISLGSFLWDKGKQYSPRCDAAERGVPSWAIPFAYRNFIEKRNKTLKSHLKPLKFKWTCPNDNDG